jgi:hypothetical protein
MFLVVVSVRMRDQETASVVQWSEFLATDPEVRARFPALPAFLRSSRSGTGSVHSALCVQLRSYLEKTVTTPVWITENTAMVIRCLDHATPSIRRS